MRIHFIAIGGAAMHNLALALHQQGHSVSGSDDEIFEPSYSRLQRAGLLPQKTGWFAEAIQCDIDAIILGMHARSDNPELLAAQKLGIPVYSYPDFMYRQSKNKKRVVIGGSHGKTTITSMIMHVLRQQHISFDYLVGSQIEGFDTMVQLNERHGVVVIEGDEYLASPIQPVPKFHLYHPHIAVLSGIAWDHINVFPTWDSYYQAFVEFVNKIESGGILIWYDGDAHLQKLVADCMRSDLRFESYGLPAHRITNCVTHIPVANGQEVALQFFGAHNLINMEAARRVCRELGVGDVDFYASISQFKGAARRLETLYKDDKRVVFRDFAHSPSKLKATIEAVVQQFADRRVVCVMELHTFSSLNKHFLPQYAGCMDAASEAVVYYNPQTLAHKKLDAISAEDIKSGFANTAIRVINDPEELRCYFEQLRQDEHSALLMSSGNWGGLDLATILC